MIRFLLFKIDSIVLEAISNADIHFQFVQNENVYMNGQKQFSMLYTIA